MSNQSATDQPGPQTWDEAVAKKLGYVPLRNSSADHCEFFVDGTHGTSAVGGARYGSSLKVYFHIDDQSIVQERGGRVLTLGAYTRGPERFLDWENPVVTDSFSIGQENVVSLNVRYWVPIDPHSYPAAHAAIEEFAFFLDVERADGSIDRLWLKNGSRNFTIKDIEDHQILGTSWPAGYEYYLAEGSPLFNQKQACR